MTWARRLASAARSLAYRGEQEKDLSSEVGAYLDLLIEEKIAKGYKPDVARREALVELGGIEQVKEEVRASRASYHLETAWQDLREAVRSARKNAASSALAILMLALGIGACTVIFSVFYSVLLQPLPFRQPDRLVELWETRLRKGWERSSVTEANFWDLRARSKAFEEMGAIGSTSASLTGFGEPQHVSVGRVSAGFFRALGVQMEAGRNFLADEDLPSRDNQVALIANKFWRMRFGSDRSIVGKTLHLDGRSFTVAGVLPEGEPW